MDGDVGFLFFLAGVDGDVLFLFFWPVGDCVDGVPCETLGNLVFVPSLLSISWWCLFSPRPVILIQIDVVYILYIIVVHVNTVRDKCND